MIGQNCVKICSLRSVEHADWVVDAGADMFGLIFAEARRQVSEDTARQIVERARAAGTRSGPKSVGVFVDQPVDEMNRIADEVGLDFVQINRPAVLDSAVRVERPVLLVIHTAPGLTLGSVEDAVERARASGSEIAAIFIDGFKAGSYGGTATRADWVMARELADRYPLMLAGGLTPENVSAAIYAVMPLGVDVSSGVETDGQKDRDKIRAFVAAARDALVRNVDRVPLRQSAEPVERS